MTEVRREIGEQEFAAQRAVRYHGHRILFWTTTLKASEVLEFVLSASAFAALWQKVPSVALVLTFVSTFVSGLVLCFQASTRLKNNLSQRNLFYEHLKLFPSDPEKRTADLLDRIKNSRLSIQKNDGTQFPCLSVRCHNELCMAIGRPDRIEPLTWFQKHIGSIFPIPYDGRKPPQRSEHETNA